MVLYLVLALWCGFASSLALLSFKLSYGKSWLLMCLSICVLCRVLTIAESRPVKPIPHPNPFGATAFHAKSMCVCVCVWGGGLVGCP